MPGRNLVLPVDEIPRFRLVKDRVLVEWPVEAGRIDIEVPWDLFCPGVAAAAAFIDGVRSKGSPAVLDFPSGRPRGR